MACLISWDDCAISLVLMYDASHVYSWHPCTRPPRGFSHMLQSPRNFARRAPHSARPRSMAVSLPVPHMQMRARCMKEPPWPIY